MTGAQAGPVLHGYLTAPGFEAALDSELYLEVSGRPGGLPRGPRWPALISRSDASSAPLSDPAFALQQLPAFTQVRGDSVSALAEAAEAVVGTALEQGSSPFLLHVFVPDPQAYRSIAGRAELLGKAFLERLRSRRRRVARGLLAPGTDGLSPEVQLVQLVLVGRGSLLCSVARPRLLPSGGLSLAPWPGGRAPVEEDRQAPSRAYRKLREGLAWLGQSPVKGERVVDLGGSPGGWAHTALSLGAAVTAVDRSPLAPALLALPASRLQMVVGNAFAYRPPAPVDWLFCDVICEPARTIALCETWMREGLCRRVVATLKFKGEGDYGMVALARSRLARLAWPFLRFKHLHHHSNEVVILASR